MGTELPGFTLSPLARTEVKIFTNFAIRKGPGRFAEWLGAGLQNRLQRFESATDLHIKTEFLDSEGVRFFDIPVLAYSWRILYKVAILLLYGEIMN